MKQQANPLNSMRKLPWFTTLVLATTMALCTPASQAQTQVNALAQAKPASAYSSGVVYDWYYLDFQLIQQTPGFSPPVAARARGYLGLALYEAVGPGMPG